MSEQTSTNPDTTHESTDNAGIGSLLRASRQRVGEELRDVATMLRIRYPYLEAIEGGRYADLPGKTYAVGFVRAYAEHLGLDSEEVVRRYKAEIETGDGKNDLHFPTPVTETGIPGGAIVFIGFTVAVLAYGGWYLGTTREGYLSDLIAPLPERLSSLVSDNEKPAASEATKPQPAPEAAVSEQAPVSSLASSPEPAPELETKVETPPEVAPAEVQGTTPAAVSEPAVSPQPEMAAPKQPKQPEQPAPSAPPASEAPASPPSEASPATQPVALQADTAAVVVVPLADVQPAMAHNHPAPPAAPQPQPEAETQAQIQSQTQSQNQIQSQTQTQSKASRISVRATANSWIEVRDDFSNTILMSRLISQGEVYQVPDQPGLILHTGNAGALEISVDGVTVPAIGADGDIRWGVQLDPGMLQAGTAVR